MPNATAIETATSDLQSAATTRRKWVLALALAFVCALAISSQSLWIDEASAARKAQQPTLHGWWREMVAQKGSDLQMPLYMAWLWLCEKIFGSDEAALRAINLIWFLPGVIALARSLSRNRALQFAAVLVSAFSPFAWYCLNEARPYAMQMSASLFLFAALIHWNQDGAFSISRERWWSLGFAAALALLCGSSMLGMIFAATPLLMGLVVLPKGRLRELAVAGRWIWAGAAVTLLALAGYYLWTMRIGARASSVATTDFKNLFFIAYELLGFSGLGPGRLEIRNGGLRVFEPHGVALALYGIIVAVLAVLAFWHLRRRIGLWKLLGLALSAGVPASFILIAGMVLHFRVLGRHFTALAPIAFFLLAAGMVAGWRRGKIGKLFIIGFFALYLASSLSLRFGLRHEKDDYRSAAAMANAALMQGKTVWWSADADGAFYYHLPLATNVTDTGKAALWLPNPSLGMIATAGRVDIVVVSRPDVYDGSSALAEFLSKTPWQRKTNFAAFVIWEQKAN